MNKLDSTKIFAIKPASSLTDISRWKVSWLVVKVIVIPNLNERIICFTHNQFSEASMPKRHHTVSHKMLLRRQITFALESIWIQMRAFTDRCVVDGAVRLTSEALTNPQTCGFQIQPRDFSTLLTQRINNVFLRTPLHLASILLCIVCARECPVRKAPQFLKYNKQTNKTNNSKAAEVRIGVKVN